jgi:TonB family protein
LASELASITRKGGLAATAYGDALRPATAPRLIGALPRLQYPEQLRDRIDGDVVVVQFVVDTTGRPDATTLQVVRSPHELLTAMVRDAVPRLQFEPASSGGPQSRSRTAAVTLSFRIQPGPR